MQVPVTPRILTPNRSSLLIIHPFWTMFPVPAPQYRPPDHTPFQWHISLPCSLGLYSIYYSIHKFLLLFRKNGSYICVAFSLWQNYNYYERNKVKVGDVMNEKQRSPQINNHFFLIFQSWGEQWRPSKHYHPKRDWKWLKTNRWTPDDQAACQRILSASVFIIKIPELLKAVCVDDGSALTIYYKMVLPLSKPIISKVLLLSIIGSRNNYLWPFALCIRWENVSPATWYSHTSFRKTDCSGYYQRRDQRLKNNKWRSNLYLLELSQPLRLYGC